MSNSTENFVTVVSVGSTAEEKHESLSNNKETNSSGYVTVLTIGDGEIDSSNKCNNFKEVVTEEVLVYRLPGERLGFGLKFEGGTKANEFVKRLFIQSCAPESPASRVTSSWGHLVEGDEVLEIDGMPVNTMTRIDCVRCLKDSNVVIKLLVRHLNVNHTLNGSRKSEVKNRSVEDLPLVISAEKKRQPPPPPPVPPRKISRKSHLKQLNNAVNGISNHVEETPPVPQSRQINQEKVKKFQSPRSSGRSLNSPDVPRRDRGDRRFSDGSLGPPDAEVYVDLFSQESTLSLSESDDTGSTISTVVDRFGSFPTTTTSSFAGSLPSTPTSVQKQLDLTNILSAYDEDELKPAIISTNNMIKIEDEKSVEESPLQPPSCFQDAPLSYGNENMRIADEVDATCKSNKLLNGSNAAEDAGKLLKKPPVPPRSKDHINNSLNCEMKEKKELNVHDENMNSITSLPRLVDFVPKLTANHQIDNSIDVMKLFLENERNDINDDISNNKFDYDRDGDLDDVYDNGMDIFNNSKWTLSPQLATIGEVEEEGQEFQFNRSADKSTPIVIVEIADGDTNNTQKSHDSKDIEGNMEIPPTDSRQPPDGHEFPDDNSEHASKQFYNNKDKFQSEEETNAQNSSLIESFVPSTNLVKNSLSMSNNELRKSFESDDIKSNTNTETVEVATNLHTRSQSLIDMSSLSNDNRQKNENRWNLMMEQRRKGFSKLKGLVIPENVNEELPAINNIPEIKSQNTSSFVPAKLDSSVVRVPNVVENDNKPLQAVSPPWITNNAIPKYSPAFKRKSLQIYSNATATNELKIEKKKDADDLRLDNLSDPPKSLESITSPTRSDCSFEYTSTNKKLGSKVESQKSKLLKELSKSEDESDNDSALSSSQSSYISRCSPSASPTPNDYDSNNKSDEDKFSAQCRLLKPSSVEAINRKNILASAKCRSGRDLKVGSPVIQRKYENDEVEESAAPEAVTNTEQVDLVEPKLEANSVVEKINVAYTQVDTIAKEITTKPVGLVVEKTTNGVVGVTMEKKELDDKTNKLSKLKQTSNSRNSPPRNTFIPIKSSTSLAKAKFNKPPEKTAPVKEITRSEYLRMNRDTKPLSVNALKKNFENLANEPPPMPHKISVIKPQVTRSVKSEILKTEIKLSKEKSTASPPKPAPIPTKVISKVKEEVKKEKVINKEIIDSSDLNLNSIVKTVILNLDHVGSSLGITLAGGNDYESKDVTIHRIRYGSVAYQDGRLKRGDKVISVNSNATKGLTHEEAVELLKEPVTKFCVVVEEPHEVPLTARRRLSTSSSTSEIKVPEIKKEKTIIENKKATNVITVIKDIGGLGFSIEGGKDSPVGDVPLTIKKIFTGGAADKSGQLQVGDELLAINEINFTNLSRIEAWNLMKKLPDGNVVIHIYR